jgi:hypothetical protein
MGHTVSVRHAKEDDLLFILSELKSFSLFFNSKISLFPSEEFAYAGMKAHIDNHVLLVAESEEGLIGFISGMYHKHIFNPAIECLTETFWWVPEKHRGGRAGLVLLNEFTRIGKMKANWIVFTLEHHSPVNDRCLLKRGYIQKEHTYLLEVM